MFFSSNGAKKSQKIKNAILDFYKLSAKSAAAKRFSVELSSDNAISDVIITLPFANLSEQNRLAQHVRNMVSDIENDKLTFKQNIPITEAKVSPIPNVKNVIAVASGKGGVGKSATAINLAYALQEQGARVGVLDADIYGPSVPIMLGNEDEHPTSKDNKIMQPLSSHGLVANSIGYLVSSENAAIWRGPMATKAIKQLTYETAWPLLDYLIVDMPPGTGDIHLTLAQAVPISAVVTVTTPQTIATADAKKGIAMFEKLDIPVIGIVENMSYFECKCGERSYPFGQGGSAKLAKQFDIELLAELPLEPAIREHADSGKSIFENAKLTSLQNQYLELARKVSFELGVFGKIHNLVRKTSGDSELGIPIVNKS